MVVVRCKATVPAELIVHTRGMVTLPDFPTALNIAKASPVLVQLVKLRIVPSEENTCCTLLIVLEVCRR